MVFRTVIQSHPRMALNGDSTSITWNSMSMDSGPISTLRVIAPGLGRLVLSKVDIDIVLCDRSTSLTPQRQRALIGATQTEALVSIRTLLMDTLRIRRVTQTGRFRISFGARSCLWKDIVGVRDKDMSTELICLTSRFSKTITF